MENLKKDQYLLKHNFTNISQENTQKCAICFSVRSSSPLTFSWVSCLIRHFFVPIVNWLAVRVILLADTALGAYLQWPLLHYAITFESITWKLLNTYSKVDKSLSTFLLTLLFIHGNKLMVSERLSIFYHISITMYIGQINSSSLCREEQGRKDSNAGGWSWIVSRISNVCIYIYVWL